MKARQALVLRCCLTVAAIVVATRGAMAQTWSAAGSLGGYGASPTGAMAGVGTSGTMIPYAGNFGGFMPYRMGGGNSLSFSSRASSAMGSAPAFSRSSPMPGGMSSMSGAIGQGAGARTRSFSSFGLQGGTGIGDGMRQQMPAADSMSVMPPSFGYPFYQPPSLLTPSSSSGGMSM